MLLVERISNKINFKENSAKYLALLFFVIIYLAILVPHLGTNELNPDAVNWHKRSEQFIVAFKTNDFLRTNQHYHPGVTLMWIVGPVVELLKQVTDLGTIYNAETYETFHYAAKLTLVTANLFLTLILVFFLTKLIGFWKAFSVVVVLNLEPFFLGNARVLHMDVLFTNLTAIALTVAFYSVQVKKAFAYVFAGFFAALAILTRSIAIGILVYNTALFIYAAIINKSKKMGVYTLVFATALVLTVFILFPAMWIRPIKTIDKTFSRSYKIGVETGHNQIFMGKYTEDPGAVFYVYALAIKVSPFLIVGTLLAVVLGSLSLKGKNKKEFLTKTLKLENTFSYIVFLGIFYLGYMIVMNTSTKKIDRYIIPLYFYFSLLSVYGYYFLITKFDYLFVKVAVGMFFSLSVLYPIYKFAPYEFIYYSPVFKNSNKANKYIEQKNFGVGIFELRNLITQRYACREGEYNYSSNFRVVIHNNYLLCNPENKLPYAGIRDTKALTEIYGRTRTFDTRHNDPTRYRILIMPIGQENPSPEVINMEGSIFRKDVSVFVHDIELWRIYVRTN